MNILVTWGIGYGPTALAAFDGALCDAGIGNYNIIPISSVIPPGTSIEVRKHIPDETEFGHRMYAVLAKEISDEHPEVCAGLGWIIDFETGKGIFVEHSGYSHDTVKQMIHDSIESMRECRKDIDSKIFSKVISARSQVAQRKACAVMCAIYKIERWQYEQSD